MDCCAAELRGEAGAKAQKAVTKTVQVSNDSKMTWKDSLYLCALSSAEISLHHCHVLPATMLRSTDSRVRHVLSNAPHQRHSQRFLLQKIVTAHFHMCAPPHYTALLAGI